MKKTNYLRFYLLALAVGVIFYLPRAGTAQCDSLAFSWAEEGGGLKSLNPLNAAADASGNTYITGLFRGTITIGGTTLNAQPDNSNSFVAKRNASGGYDWVKGFIGGSQSIDPKIELDAFGNVLVYGSFSQTVDFSGVQLISNGGTDVFVVKLDNSGNMLWAKNHGGTSQEYSGGLAIDSNNNIVLSGRYSSVSMTIGTTTITQIGSEDVFLTKVDPSGNPLWTRKAGGSARESTSDVVIDSGGNIFVTGFFESTALFGAINVVGFGGRDIFVAKYDSNGNEQWVQNAGGNNRDEAIGLEIDPLGNPFLWCSYNSTATFGSITMPLPTVGVHYVAIAKMDGNGNFLWVEQLSTPANPYPVSDMKSDGLGNLYLIGTFEGNLTLGSSTVTSSGKSDVFLAKYDNNGNVIWLARDGWLLQDRGVALAIGNNSDLHLIGSFAGNAVFSSNTLSASSKTFIAKYNASGVSLSVSDMSDISYFVHTDAVSDASGNVYATGIFNGIVTMGATTLTANYGAEMFVAKYDNTGNVLWARQCVSYQGIWNSRTHIALDPNGHVIVAGPASPNNSTFGSTTVVAGSNGGIFLAAYDPLGNVTWANVYNPIGINDLCTDNSGNILCVGTLNSAYNAGPISLSSNGGQDAYLMKFDNVGTPLWGVNIGGADHDQGSSVTVDGSNNVLVGGLYRGSISIGSTNLTSLSSSSNGFVAKYNATGNPVWARSLNVSGFNAPRKSLECDNSGNIYTCGNFYGILNFGASTLNSIGSSDAAVFKYDSNGNELWAVNVGGTDGDYISDIALDSNGNLYAIGEYNLSAFASTTQLTSLGLFDLFLSKYDANGVFQWAKSYGTPQTISVGGSPYNDDATFIITDPSDNLWFSGTYGDGVLSLDAINLPNYTAKTSFFGKLECAINCQDLGAEAGANQTICTGEQPAQLCIVSSPPSATLLRWEGDLNCSGNWVAVGAGNTCYQPPILNDTVCYRAVLEVAGCEVFYSDTVVISVKPLPAQPAALNGTFCPGEIGAQVCVTNPDPASQYDWYDAISGGALLTSDSDCYDVPTGVLPMGPNFVYIERIADNCTSQRRPVIITIEDLPDPMAPDSEFCRGENNPEITATATEANAVFEWYDVAVGGTALTNVSGANNEAYIPDVSADGFSKVWVQYSKNGCTSGRTEVEITVTKIPAPTVPNANFCTGEAGASVCASNPRLNSTFEWFDAPTGGASQNTGDCYAPYPTGNSGSATFYVRRDSANGCFSDRAQVTVNVTDLAPPVAASPPQVCPCETTNLVATGSSADPDALFTWWDASTGGNPVMGATIMGQDLLRNQPWESPQNCNNPTEYWLGYVDTIRQCSSARTLVQIFLDPACNAPDCDSARFAWAEDLRDAYVQNVAIDNGGAGLITGAFENFTVVNGVSLASLGDYDIFVAKLDNAGNALWARSIGGTQEDRGFGITSDAGGNVIVTGRFSGVLSPFLPGGSPIISAGHYDFFIAKYDPNGNPLWIRTGGGPDWDEGRNVVADAAGNLYVTGSHVATGSYDGTVLTSAGSRDVFLAKYSPSGALLWAKNAGGVADDRAYDLAIDDNNDLYLTGWFSGPANFDGFAVTPAGARDVFLAKYDANGAVQFVRTAGGADTETGYSIAHRNGTLAVAGFFGQGSGAPATFGGATTLNSNGGIDLFLATYDTNGALLWAKGEGGAGDDQALDVAFDNFGNLYLTGVYSGAASIGGDALTASSPSGFEIYAARYDANGNGVWGLSYGNTLADVGYSVAVDPSHKLWFGGSYGNTAGTDLQLDNIALPDYGARSGVVGKLDCTPRCSEAGGTLTGGATHCSAQNSGRLELVGYNGVITGWEVSFDNFATSFPFNYTLDYLNYANVGQTLWFRAIVQAPAGCAVASNIAVIDPNGTPPSAGVVGGPATLCQGGAASATLTLSGHGGAVVRWESSTDGFATVTNIPNTTATLNVSGLNLPTQYRAVVGSNGCEAVSLAHLVTPVNCCPAAENISVGAITDVSATVDWTFAASGNVFGFNVYYRPVGSTAPWNLVFAGAPPAGLSGLSPDTEYDLYIETLCLTGVAYSTLERFKTLDKPVCSIPTNLTVVNTGLSDATLAWTAVPGAVSYVVRFRDESAPASWQNVTTTTNSIALTGLNMTTWYRARVRAVCGPGNSSSYSGSELFQTQPQAVGCGQPGNVSVGNISDDSAEISWSPVVSATRYQVQYREKGTTQWTTVNVWGLNETVTGLNPLTTYQYRVRAICGPNLSSFTTVSEFTTLSLTCDPPAAPLSITTTYTSATISWAPVPDALVYSVYYRRIGFPNWAMTSTVNPSVVILGLLPNEDYEYRIQTYCQTSGVSTYSAIYNFFTANAGIRAGSLNMETETQTVSVYPNPNNGRFNISFESAKAGRGQARVLDMKGSVIRQETIKISEGENDAAIDLDNAPSGIYLLEFERDGKIHRSKISVL